ncbi:AvrD family protein [Segniliparus rugosus]|nr:AvrD family protein [Segniliparus rugosus]
MFPTITSSIDDILGPSEKRFFGSGYRRVVYGMHDVGVTSAEDGQVHAEAAIGLSYPGSWSKKKDGKERRPHFSTLDALILGAELAELCLARSHGWGYDSEDLARSWVRKVHIAAGAKPQEDLESLQATATRKAAPEIVLDDGFRVSVFSCRMGTMRVRLEVAHPHAPARSGQWSYQDRSTALCPPEHRYYGDGFKAWRHEIVDVHVDPAAPSARGTLHILPVDPESAAAASTFGLEAAYGPSASLVDLLVAASQLTQAVLYDFDGIRRENSDTLWMRRTTATAEHPHRPHTSDGVPVNATLVNPDRVVFGGDVWSTTDVIGTVGGVTLESAIAHRVGHSDIEQAKNATEQKEQ